MSCASTATVTNMTATKSKLRPFFSYYGGKWRDTPRLYPAPAHETIVEPFAGSAGYSVRYAHHKVILCDLDPYIAAVWRYLIRTSAQEILELPDIEVGETTDDLDVCQEARWLIGYWLNSATTHPCKRPSAWMRAGDHAGSFWGARVRERIASQVDKIRHWNVIECSYQECPVRGVATWFV